MTIETPKKELHLFIEHLLTEFKDYLPLTTIYKLYVIDCASKDMSNKDIFTFLDNSFEKDENGTHNNKYSADDINEVRNDLKNYHKADQKKLNRLKKVSCIQQVLRIIGFTNFIHSVIEKYPFPSTVGFYNNTWTKTSMRKYLQLYFNFPKNTKSNKLFPRDSTIHKAINYPTTPYSVCPLNYSLKELFSYYFNQSVPVDFYYVFFNKKNYEVSPSDKIHRHKSHRYDETFFATLLHITEFTVPDKNFSAFSYVKSEKIPNLIVCFDELYKIAIQHSKKYHDDTNYKIVFLVCSKNLSDEFSAYRKELSEIPCYSLITFKKISSIITAFEKLEQDSLKTNELSFKTNTISKENTNFITISTLKDNLITIKEIIPTLEKITLKRRIAKKEYIQNVKNILHSYENISKELFRNNSLVIRYATFDDLDFIKKSHKNLSENQKQLYSKLVTSTQDITPPDYSNKYWKNLINKKNGYILISTYDHIPIGMAVVKEINTIECRLIYLYVDKYNRHSGIGDKLLSISNKIAKEQGYAIMSVYTYSNNDIAKSLYKKSKFTDIKIRMELSLKDNK